MDLVKFIFLLNDKKLLFPRSDVLYDRFEGAFSSANVRHWEVLSRNSEKVIKGYQRIYHDFRKSTFISCWHINETESAAMWKIYSVRNYGIAIQSKIGLLERAIKGDEMMDIQIAKVRYIDYEREPVPEGFAILPFIYKRKCFEHEKELRAIIQLSPGDPQKIKIGNEPEALGIPIAIDLDILIEKIYIAPKTPRIYSNVITTLLDKFGLEKPMLDSSLEAKPVYVD